MAQNRATLAAIRFRREVHIKWRRTVRDFRDVRRLARGPSPRTIIASKATVFLAPFTGHIRSGYKWVEIDPSLAEFMDWGRAPSRRAARDFRKILATSRPVNPLSRRPSFVP